MPYNKPSASFVQFSTHLEFSLYSSSVAHLYSYHIILHILHPPSKDLQAPSEIQQLIIYRIDKERFAHCCNSDTSRTGLF